MTKKFLSALLAVLMVISMVPVAAMAEEPSPTEPVKPEVEAYGFAWNPSANSALKEGCPYKAGSDWMKETMWVVLKDGATANQNLWFEVTVGSGESAAKWGCAATTSTKTMYAFSFLNRGNQWELHPSDITINYGGNGATTHAESYMKAGNVTLSVYSPAQAITGEQKNGAPTAAQLGKAIFTETFAIEANTDVLTSVPATVKALPANLTAEAGKDDPSYGHATEYTATQADNAITLKAAGLEKTKNTNNVVDYWVGVALPKESGVKYAWGFGSKPATPEYKDVSRTQTVDGKTYTTLYWSSDDTNTPWSEKTGYISVKYFDGQTTDYTVNFDVAVKVPAIHKVGYMDDSTKAKKAIKDDRISVGDLGDNPTTDAGSDADKMTMWVILKDLDKVASDGDAKDYKVVVTDPDSTVLSTKSTGKVGPGAAFNTTSGSKAIWWTFNPEANVSSGTVSSGTPKSGTYTFRIYRNDEPIGEAMKLTLAKLTTKVGVTETDYYFDVSKKLSDQLAITEPTQKGKVFKGWKVGTEELSNEQLLAETLTADTVAEAVFDTPVTEGMSIGFEWNGVDANDAINADIKATGKDYTVTDCIDQAFWLLVNGPMTDANTKRFYEIKKGSTVILSGAMTGGDGKIGIVYDSFLMNREPTTPDKGYIKEGDVLTFTLYEGTDNKGKVLVTDTYPVPANPLKIVSAEVTNYESKTINVKFTEDLLGRYVIEVKNEAGEVVATASTECDRGNSDAGKVAKAAGQDLTARALTAGTYTVSIRPNITGAPAIDTYELTLSDAIDSVVVKEVEGEAPDVSEKESTIFTAVADNSTRKITITGSVANPPETIKLKLDAKNGEVSVADVKEVTLKLSGKTYQIEGSNELTTKLGTKYTIETEITALETAVAKPATDPIVDETKIKVEDPEVVAAVRTAVESTEVHEDSHDVLTDAATKVAADKVENNVVKTTEIVADLNKVLNKVLETPVEFEDTKIVVLPVVKVELINYSQDENDEGTVTEKVLDVEIKAEYKVVATAVDPAEDDIIVAGEDVEYANAIEIPTTGDKKLDITESIKLTINLPTGFVESTVNELYVLHKNAHYHKGEVENGTLTFISEDGLSPFKIKSSVTAMEAKIGETYYLTLQEAVDAVTKDGTVDVINLPANKTITNVSKTFTLRADKDNADWITNIDAKAASGKEFTNDHFDVDVGETYATCTFEVKDQSNPSKPSNPGTITTPGGNTPGGNTPSTSHEVKVPATIENGKITVSPTSAKKGDTVTITATPDEGYELDTVTVTDASGKSIAVSGTGNKRTFTMPDSAVNVSATFKKAGTSGWKNPFNDVGDKAWYFKAVQYVNENGLMNGSDKGEFLPESKLTRAEFAQILYNKEGRPAVTGQSKFPDVVANAWYANAINWATQKGVLAGYSNGKVGPNDRITREQLASLLWRYENSPAPKGTAMNFKDVNKISGWAKTAMQWAVENGVMNGTDKGYLNPTASASRAEAAQMLMNYFSKK